MRGAGAAALAPAAPFRGPRLSPVTLAGRFSFRVYSALSHGTKKTLKLNQDQKESVFGDPHSYFSSYF